MVAGSMEIYQFTTLREVWLSPHQFFTKLKTSTWHSMEIVYTKFLRRQEEWITQTEINLLPTGKTVSQLIFTKLTPP